MVTERSSYLFRHMLLLVVMNGFLFPNPVLSSFPSEAEETLLIDIASNSEYHSEWSLFSFNIYLIEYPLY